MSQHPHLTVPFTREAYSIPAEQTEHYQKDNSNPQPSDSEGFRDLAPLFRSPRPYVSPYASLPERQGQLPLTSVVQSRHTPSLGPSVSASSGATLSAPTLAYSSSSQDETVYSNPSPRQYRFDLSSTMSRSPSQVSACLDKTRIRAWMF